MIKQLLVSIVIGFALAVHCLVHDARLLNALDHYCKQSLERALGCRMQGTLSGLSLYPAGVYFNDVTMSPHEGKEWGWGCKRMHMAISLYRLLVHQELALYLSFEDIWVKSTWSGTTFGIEPHVHKVLEKPNLPLPVSLHGICVSRANFIAHDEKNTRTLSCTWSQQLQKDADCMFVNMRLEDASIHCKDGPLINAACGSCNLQCTPQGVLCDATIAWNIAGIDSKERRVTADIKNSATGASVQLRNEDGSCDMVLQRPNQSAAWSMKGTLPCSCVTACIPQLQTLVGNCAIEGTVNLSGDQATIASSATLQQARYHDHRICDKATMTLNGSMQELYFTARCHDEDRPFNINAVYDNGKQCINATLSFDQPMSIRAGLLLKTMNMNMQYMLNGGIQAAWDLLGEYEQKEIVCTGSAHGSVNNVIIEGICNNLPYTVLCNNKKIDARYGDQEKSLFKARLSFFDTPTFELSCAASLVSPFTAPILVQDDGYLHLSGLYDEHGVRGKLDSCDVIAKIPRIYNVLTNISTHYSYDIPTRTLQLHDSSIRLSRGAMSCSQGIIIFDRQYNPDYISVPLALNGCLLNLKRDFFSVASGLLHYTRQHQQDTISGYIILDKTRLKENLFSLAYQKKFFDRSSSMSFGYDAACDLTIQTKDPIVVQTGLLSAHAQAAFSLKGTIQSPIVSGEIGISSGIMNFLHKPLYITKATLSWLPGALHDPLFECIARNKIRKYTVTMRVSGSMQQPHIFFESSPSLTQEQIISLLLGGSEDSLAGAGAAALVNGMKQIFFESEHKPSTLRTLFSYVFSPLRYVYLVPSFSDQSGRGGVRGAIEIDIGERWHALIQKNFSLSEDTRFELEYALSDEINIRGFRDERRDIGAEVEFRWKF